MLSVSYIYKYISSAFAQSSVSGELPILSWIRGDLHWSNHRYDQAAKFYKSGLDTYPNHCLSITYRIKLAFALFRSYQMIDAERQLKEVINKQPANLSALIQLATLYRWCGRDKEAAWLLHRNIIVNENNSSEELQALYCLSVFDSNEISLIDTAEEIVSNFSLNSLNSIRPQLALARYEYMKGRRARSLDILMHLLRMPIPHVDAAIYAAELCIREHKFEEATNLLHQVLRIIPDHPRLNSLLSELYLKPGDNFNNTYALQLALIACKSSGWVSVREMRILAEAYYHSGEKFSALLVAKRAKNIAETLIDNSELSQELDNLIESLDIAV